MADDPQAQPDPAETASVPDPSPTAHPDEPAEVAKRLAVAEAAVSVAELQLAARGDELLKLSDRVGYLEEHLKTSLDQAVEELRPAGSPKHKGRKAGAA